jgi:hypothetical protein
MQIKQPCIPAPSRSSFQSLSNHASAVRAGTRGRTLALAAALAALNACTWAPRNNQPLVHATDAFAWQGALATPDTQVSLNYIDNIIGSPVSISQATSSHTASTTDAAGTQWFGWSTTAQLPLDGRAWKNTSAHTLTAKLITVQLDSQGNLSAPAIFDFGAATDQCMRDNQNGGGVAIINACRSQSGTAALTAPCGTRDEPCCTAKCDSGLGCDGASGAITLGTCKQATGSSCIDATDCVTGLLCRNGACAAPAQSGAPCTTTTDCISGDSCIGGVCSIPCTPGQACIVASVRAGTPCATGVTQCTPTTKTCMQTVFPSTEVCDNKDNDCNGKRDDITPTSCTNAANDQPTLAGCPAGRVHGRTACSAGRSVCTFNQGGNTPDYCTIAGPQCGDGEGESGPPCIPGSTAVNGKCGHSLCSPLSCWIPADVTNSKQVCPPQG